MKFLVVLSVALLSMGAFAQDLNTMKQQANSDINKRMTSLQSTKDCIGNANTMEKFKACKYDMYQDMKMQKMEKMEKMEGMDHGKQKQESAE